MVIIYNLDTKKIIRAEDNTNVPILPFNMTLKEKELFFSENNQGYITLENEIGSEIYNYNLVFNDKGEFKELKRKEEFNG